MTKRRKVSRSAFGLAPELSPHEINPMKPRRQRYQKRIHSPLTYTTYAMSLHGLGLRAAQQSLRQTQTSVLRTFIRRQHQLRSASTSHMPGGTGTKLTGNADNAFNRERAAVKAHAAATSGA